MLRFAPLFGLAACGAAAPAVAPAPVATPTVVEPVARTPEAAPSVPAEALATAPVAEPSATDVDSELERRERAKAHQQRGEDAFRLGRFDVALHEFGFVLVLVDEPRLQGLVHYNIGRTWQRIGDEANARRNFSLACTLGVTEACGIVERPPASPPASGLP